MSGLYERLRKEREDLKIQGRKEGRQEVKYEVIENMLNMKVAEEIIIAATKATKEEIEDVKNKIQQRIAK